MSKTSHPPWALWIRANPSPSRAPSHAGEGRRQLRTLDQGIEGSNPSSPANSSPANPQHLGHSERRTTRCCGFDLTRTPRRGGSIVATSPDYSPVCSPDYSGSSASSRESRGAGRAPPRRTADPVAPRGGLRRRGCWLAMRRLIAPREPTWAPTGEPRRVPAQRPGLFAKLGRVHTVAGRGRGASAWPYGLPRPGQSTHPSSSCTVGTAPRCCPCRTAHRQRRAARRDQRSGPSRGRRPAASQDTSPRARHARRGARGR